jgi:hypothetical protein
LQHPIFKLGLLALSLTTAFSVSAQSTAGDAALKARIDALEKNVADLSNSVAKVPTDTGLPLHGFIDVGYASTKDKAPSYDKSGFKLGTFDIYLTPRFGDKVKGLIELAFEFDREGGLGTDLERMQLGYELADTTTLWAGRFHTPYGYWNTAFHHGAQIQTSITRPRFIAFEDQGGILPAHTVGTWLNSKLDTSLGRVNIDIYAGNSGSLRDGTLDYNASGYDRAAYRAGFNLGLSPKAIPGLSFGIHALSDKVNSYNATPTQNGEIQVQVSGGYLYYESDKFEVISEYYAFNNTDLFGNARTNRSTASFLQVGYQLFDRTTVFGRFERADLSTNDPYFTLMNLNAGTGGTSFGSSYHQSTLGVRYDLDPRSALKLQLEQIVDDGNAGQTVNWIRTQFAVRF